MPRQGQAAADAAVYADAGAGAGRTESSPLRLSGLGGIGDGEFDPGSERTLAARLKHASRANRGPRAPGSGGRVSSAWATCPPVGDSAWKHAAIPHETAGGAPAGKGPTGPPGDGPASH